MVYTTHTTSSIPFSHTHIMSRYAPIAEVSLHIYLHIYIIYVYILSTLTFKFTQFMAKLQLIQSNTDVIKIYKTPQYNFFLHSIV